MNMKCEVFNTNLLLRTQTSFPPLLGVVCLLFIEAPGGSMIITSTGYLGLMAAV